MLRARGHEMRVQNYNIFTYLPNIQAIFFTYAVTISDTKDHIIKQKPIFIRRLQIIHL